VSTSFSVPKAPGDVAKAVAAGVSRLVAGRLSPAEREAQLDALAELYAEQTDVRHPFAPLGDTPLRTRAQLREHFAAAGPLTAGAERFEPVNTRVHATGDPEVVVVEFAYAISAGGRDSEVPCIFVVRVRDGRIVESRDYGHHVGLARAFGRLGDLASALAGTPEAGAV
jgi:ketosteroid isomerase-like protein